MEPTMHTSPKLISLLSACALSLGAGLAHAQSWPAKPIKMVVASAPGGILDTVGRTIAARLSESLGQPVVVENRAGAGGIIGTDLVAKAAPDGYTIGKIATSHAINPAVYAKMPYDTVKDLAPVTQTVSLTNMLVAHPSVPAGSVAELIALAKAKPKTLTYGSAGNGQSNHLSGALFASLAGIDITHVPYKGSAPALTDVIAGNISMMYVDILSATPHVKAGKLKGLGVTGLKRSVAAPEFPAVSETVKGFNGSSWLGMVAPGGTPKEILNRLAAETAKILAMPEVRDRFLAQGVEPVGSTPEQFAAFIDAEMPRWARAAASAGIQKN
jgi:tripartite-type tricarboxylate transporter receptor subunit TctC